TQAVDRVWIDEAGLVGIGTSSPSAPLTINGTDPFLQMRNANVNKGFVRVQANDLKIGTNATNTTGKLVFQTKETDRVWIDENGLVGIGTADPTTSLTINGTNPMIQMNNQASEKGFIQVSGSDFKIGTNQANTTGNFIIRTQGVDRFRMNQFGEAVFSDNIADHELTLETGSPAIGFSNNTLANAQINLLANNDFKFSKNATNGGRIILHNSSNIANSYALYLTTGGHLNFGTGLSPTGYRASVEGKVIATDFVTLSIANWPDYVFAEQYHLRSISELKNYIQQHKHLPNIPPAAEMEKNGIQLGEMTRKLVEKLEEQALYIIQLEERLEKLEKTAGK
ncbi:MAG: hypothetical protein JNM68_01240, partial [Dinghuibacter sp.]|nr:hypothetical protein [Dinghuibacter sp.]